MNRDVAVMIRDAIARGDQHAKDSEAAYREAGLLLIDVKQKAPHGTWLPWLKAEGFDERQAQRLMTLAKSDATVLFRDVCHPEPEPITPRSSNEDAAPTSADVDARRVPRWLQNQPSSSPRMRKCCDTVNGGSVRGYPHKPGCRNDKTPRLPTSTPRPLSLTAHIVPDDPQARMREYAAGNVRSLEYDLDLLEKNRDGISEKQIEQLTALWERLGALIERWGHEGGTNSSKTERRDVGVLEAVAS